MWYTSSRNDYAGDLNSVHENNYFITFISHFVILANSSNKLK